MFSGSLRRSITTRCCSTIWSSLPPCDLPPAGGDDVLPEHGELDAAVGGGGRDFAGHPACHPEEARLRTPAQGGAHTSLYTQTYARPSAHLRAAEWDSVALT